MNFKTIIASAVMAGSLVAASSAYAAVVGVFDAGADFQAAPVPILTLDRTAVDTALTFDTTSTRFNFIGGGDSNEFFQIVSTGPKVLSVGNLVTSAEFDTAEIIVDGFTIDLKATPDVTFAVAVGSPFILETNFVDDPNNNVAGTFDFTLSAAPVPVPAGILLMGTALAGFGVMRRRKKAA